MGGRMKWRLRCLRMGSEIVRKTIKNSVKSALFTCHTHRSSTVGKGWALKTWKTGGKNSESHRTHSHRETTGRPKPWTSLPKLLFKNSLLPFFFFFLGPKYNLLQFFKMVDTRKAAPFPVWLIKQWWISGNRFLNLPSKSDRGTYYLSLRLL